ncbi:hypothetical protein MAHJHV63_34090 [Mycobacterium avium subsp. hominissuis]
MTGRTSATRRESTACAPLVIIDDQPHASPVIRAGASQFTLLHRPSGWRVAAAADPAALHRLAHQLAWFGVNATDPCYLSDPANADICESIRELLQQWLSFEIENRPSIGPPSLWMACPAGSSP